MIGWLTGSRRLREEIGAIRQILARQDERIEAIGRARLADQAMTETLRARLDEMDTALDAANHKVTQLTERLDSVEAHPAVERLSELVAGEQRQRTVLEQAILKLEKRAEAEADESRTTATALLQRLDAVAKMRAATE